jgi:hypothetical protein
MLSILTSLAVCLCLLSDPLPDVEVSLRGSPLSMERQHRVAVDAGLTFVGTLEEMELLAQEGHLVPIQGGPDYEVMDWVFPYALPVVHTFVERFAAQYVDACGEPLVVTSLTRPFSEQPRNAHQLSVHPAGMAIDLRIPQNSVCREFLESALLEKEEAGLLDITRERAPPHYHIAVFPEPYAAYAELQGPVRPPAPEASGAQTAAEAETRGRGMALLLVALLLSVSAIAAAWALRHYRSRPGA